MLLSFDLPPSNAQCGCLERHKYDGEVDTCPALAAKGAKVGSLAHGNGLPPAGPADQSIDFRGGVDGVKEGHGDDSGYEADKRGNKHHWCMQGCVVAELRED